MSGTMSQADLVADLQSSLMDCKSMFTAANSADFIRQLNAAADDLSRIVPEYNRGSIDLVADQDLYAAPADLKSVDRLVWGQKERSLNPWDPCYVRPRLLPKLSTVTQAGVLMLELTPAPGTLLIQRLGAAMPFTYLRLFTIDPVAANTTVPALRRSLLLLRAQAEAMKELANRGVAKPVQLRDGMTQGPKNGTPAALYDQFMRECERQAA